MKTSPKTSIKKTARAGAGRGSKSKKPSFIEQARREQIVRTAATLFRRQGFTNTTLEDIARAADVSRGVLFYYFDGKREIGEHTVRNTLRAYSEYVQERLAPHPRAIDRLLEFIHACIAYHRENPRVYIEYIELVGSLGDDKDKHRFTRRVNKRTRELLVRLIEEAQANGELQTIPAQTLADVIQAFIDGMMETNAMEPDVVDMNASKDLFLEMLVARVTPRP